jgi:hypothetical protein
LTLTQRQPCMLAVMSSPPNNRSGPGARNPCAGAWRVGILVVAHLFANLSHRRRIS